jgi:hypothetical protein
MGYHSEYFKHSSLFLSSSSLHEYGSRELLMFRLLNHIVMHRGRDQLSRGHRHMFHTVSKLLLFLGHYHNRFILFLGPNIIVVEHAT